MSLDLYTIISITALAIVSALAYIIIKRRQTYQLSRLASLAFVLIIAGIVFGEDSGLGYGLMGTGVVLAVVDVVRRARRKDASSFEQDF